MARESQVAAVRSSVRPECAPRSSKYVLQTDRHGLAFALVQPADEELNDHTRSSYGRDYWLRRCDGFLVETPTRRIGRVAGIRYSVVTNEPEVIEVRAGLFGRTVLLISVDDITEILPKERLVMLTDPPRPLPG